MSTTLSAVFSRQIELRGRWGSLQTPGGASAPVKFTSRRYTAQELMGDIKENDLSVRISAQGLSATFIPLRRGTRLIDKSGTVRTFKDDPTPLYDGETLVGYVGRIRG